MVLTVAVARSRVVQSRQRIVVTGASRPHRGDSAIRLHARSGEHSKGKGWVENERFFLGKMCMNADIPPDHDFQGARSAPRGVIGKRRSFTDLS